MILGRRTYFLALVLLASLFVACAPRPNSLAHSSRIQSSETNPPGEVQPVFDDSVSNIGIQESPVDPSILMAEEDTAFVQPSWKSFRFAIQAMEDMQWVVAQRYLNLAKRQMAQEVKKASPEDSLYYAEMPMMLKLASDEVLINCPEAVKMAAESELDDVESIDEDMADDTALFRLEKFLDTLDVSQFTLPVQFNERVVQEIFYLTGKAKSFMSSSLNRKTAFDSLIYAKIDEAKMPRDLIYLSLVESGFKVRAYSRAKASGLWQFIPETGKRYGVDVDFWLDQRRNPEMATDAALKYLKDLYGYFGDWQLAMAAYNCGEGRVRRLIRELKADSTRDSTQAITYWDLPLPTETMHYVPRILAAMVIGHFPEHYDIEIKPQKLSAYDTVTVYDSFGLDEIAKAIKVKPDTLRNLNAELIMGFTPPNRESYVLKIPVGKRDLFVKNYDKIEKNNFSGWVHHKVKKGESLGKIASLYKVKVADIQQANDMRNMKVRAGKTLLIPIRVAGETSSSTASKKNVKAKIYVVKLGDNLANIARKFNVDQNNIRIWNDMDAASVVAVGDTIFVSKPNMKPSSGKGERPTPPLSKTRKYVVQSGDSYGTISEMFGVPVGNILLANKGFTKRLAVGDSVYILKYTRKLPQAPAQPVVAPEAPASKEEPKSSVKVEPVAKDDPKAPVVKSGEKLSVYTVEPGDNLGYISMLFGMSISRLQELNNLGKSVDIRAGQKLYVIGDKKDLKSESKKTEKKDDKKPEPKKTVESFRQHTVKKGESLWDISRQYQVTIEDIVKWNELPDTKIREGMVLKIKK